MTVDAVEADKVKLRRMKRGGGGVCMYLIGPKPPVWLD